MSSTSRACRPQSPSNRNRRRTIPDRRSEPSPRFTTTCGCSSPASANRASGPRGGPRGADGQPDGGFGHGAPARRATHAARPGGRRPQGRARPRRRGPAIAGLHPRAHRRPAARAGRSDRARSETQAFDRGGRRSIPGPRRPGATPRRVVRDRACALRRARSRRADGRRRRRRHRVLGPVRLPRVRLRDSGAGTPGLLVQQPAGACQRCDGLGVQTFFDPARNRRPSRTEPSRWSRPRLGPAQLLLFSDGPVARRALRLSTSTPPSATCPEGARRHAERERLRGHPIHVPHRAPRETTSENIRSKA